MADDWASDVKKFAPDADDGVIAAIVRYCGIALQSSDAKLVSFTDKDETDRVRENFLKKKLGLTDSDSVLDSAIASVGDRISGTPTHNRVTVYYLLAAHFGKLGVFGTSDTTASVMTTTAAPMRTTAAAVDVDHRGVAATGWGDYIPLALLVLGGAALLSYLGRPAPTSVPVAAPIEAVAATPAIAEAIPEGMGLINSEVDGAPFVSVYFDTASTAVAPEMSAAAAAIKTYLDSHADTGVAVSGYNDPRGDAAMNAELSKNRAFAVRTALVTAGVPEGSVDLVRPEATTDTTTDMTNARRVDIRVVSLTGRPVAVTTTKAVAAPAGE